MKHKPIHKRTRKLITPKASKHIDETLAKEFLETMNHKFKKGEKDTWMVHNLDHLFDNR